MCKSFRKGVTPYKTLLVRLFSGNTNMHDICRTPFHTVHKHSFYQVDGSFLFCRSCGEIRGWRSVSLYVGAHTMLSSIRLSSWQWCCRTRSIFAPSCPWALGSHFDMRVWMVTSILNCIVGLPSRMSPSWVHRQVVRAYILRYIRFFSEILLLSFQCSSGDFYLISPILLPVRTWLLVWFLLCRARWLCTVSVMLLKSPSKNVISMRDVSVFEVNPWW
mgnify:CR=1 FL=1